MGKVDFPALTELEDGQVASAATMNGYASAALALLGVSHVTFPLQHVPGPSTDVYDETYVTTWLLWCYHATQTLYYKLHIKIHYGNEFDRDWYYRIQVSPDAGETWYTAKEETGTQNTYQNREGTVDLTTVSDGSGGYIADHVSMGGIYQWRLQVKCGRQPNPADCTVHCQPWAIGMLGAVFGWQAPHVFAAETSAAAHLNGWRTDLLALRNALPTTTIGTSQPWKLTLSEVATWVPLTRGTYRYRPNGLYIAVAGSGWGNETWQFRVKVEDDTVPAAKSAVVYTSEGFVGDEAVEIDEYSWTRATANIDLTAGEAAAALAAAGIALALGNYYRVVIEIYSAGDPGRVWAIGAMMYRISHGTPHGDWNAMQEWAHSATDFGPTKLNKVSANLVTFYSGNEALHYETPGVDVLPGTNGHTLVHRRRYLAYMSAELEQVPLAPTIYYGAGLAQTYSPGETYKPGEAPEWDTMDLDDLGMVYGSVYFVNGCDACIEGDLF